MTSRPDLFVICKSCGSEVSPYVTECPYCGKRLRKRAPKIERGTDGPQVKESKRAKRRRERDAAPRLSRMRSGEIPGISADEDRRPYVTIALVVAGLIFWVLYTAEILLAVDLGLVELGTFSFASEGWRLVTSLFLYASAVAQFATLLAVGIFGWLLERRHGPLAPLLLFFAAGIGGNVLAVEAGTQGLILGGGGAALGLLAAWAVPVLLARRRRGPDDDDADLLGTAVLAAVLLLLPAAREEVSIVATVAGGLVGAVAGLLLARLKPR